MINKKILFLLVIHWGILLGIYAQTPVIQVQPLAISLKFRVDTATFLVETEIVKDRILASFISAVLLKDMTTYLDTLARNKQKCVDFSRDTTKKDRGLTVFIHFYRGETIGRLTNMPFIKISLFDNGGKDTIQSGGFPVTQLMGNKVREDNSYMRHLDLRRIQSDFIRLADSVLNNYLAPCDGKLHYSQQKLHEKAIIFLAYPTNTPNKKDEKYLPLIDNVINNKFISMQIADEKIIKDKHFIFYPYNKETKDIKSNIAIQLQLVQDKTGDYEIKATFVGKDINLKSSTRAEMPASVSIKLDKKRMDNGDYTELFYKLNYFISGVYTYYFSK